MIEMSESIQELAIALSKAQSKINYAIKASDNSEMEVKYADLAAIWAACRRALTTNGLAVLQFPGAVTGNFMSMTTMLVHCSGQWIRQPLTIPMSRLDEQSYGAAVTYARRYALAAVVGVCPKNENEDVVSVVRRRSASHRPQGLVDAAQLMELTALIAEIRSDEATFCGYLGVPSLAALPAHQFPAAIQALEQKRSLSWRAAS